MTQLAKICSTFFILQQLWAVMCLKEFPFNSYAILGEWDGKDSSGESDERILIPGYVAHKGAFPFVVSVRYLNVHWCGGSIIHKLWILTAANCVANSRHEPHKYEVSMGTNSIQALAVIRDVVAIICGHRTSVHNIALLQVDQAIPFTKFIQPILLDNTKVRKKVSSVAAGWGSIENTHLSQFAKLLYVNLITRTSDYCKERLESMFKPNINMCTYTKKGQAACSVDYGSPLFRRVEGVWKQIGIVAQASGCSESRPDVHTRLSNYIKWIRKYCNCI